MSELEFRIMILRKLAGVEKKNIESLSMEKKEVKSSQKEIKNGVTETQSWMNATAARMGEAEQQISNIEDKIMENNEARKLKQKSMIQELEN